MAVIFWISGRAGSGEESRSILSSLFGLQGFWLHLLNGIGRKALHMIEYAALCILSYRSLVYGHGIPPPVALLGGVLLTVAYACTDEYHQTFVPGREGQVQDVLIDAAGAVAGTFLYFRRTTQAKETS
jgi:VanZ family protein